MFSVLTQFSTIKVIYTDHKNQKVVNLSTPRRRRLTSLVVRGTALSVARYCISHSYYRDAIVTELVRKLQHEIKWICSDNANSIMKNKEDATLLSFKWELIINEAQKSTPLFYSFLQKLLGTSQQAKFLLVQYMPLCATCIESR